ncbi:lysophospholipid acyltransferase family protein [Janibacter alittae]|uniref:Lysophospholipid acyltransferase family protein n=1 Tax=Janibacter alittae TaxID=3115209 RepID=A0ABZ2MF91_9MICO
MSSSSGAIRVAEWLLRRVLVGPPLRAWLRLEVEGREHVPATGPVIIASNHLSFVDSMVIPLAAGRKVGFLGKAEYLQGTGPLGWFKRLWFGEFGGMIPVDRSDAKAAARSLELAEAHLAARGAFAIYPEGTRSRDGMLHKGRTGVGRLAVASRAPVVPCGLIGTDRAQPTGAKVIRPRKVTVRFAPPVDVAALEAELVKGKLLRAITDETMDAIAQRSGQVRSSEYAPRPGTSAPLG